MTEVYLKATEHDEVVSIPVVQLAGRCHETVGASGVKARSARLHGMDSDSSLDDVATYAGDGAVRK